MIGRVMGSVRIEYTKEAHNGKWSCKVEERT